MLSENRKASNAEKEISGFIFLCRSFSSLVENTEIHGEGKKKISRQLIKSTDVAM